MKKILVISSALLIAIILMLNACNTFKEQTNSASSAINQVIAAGVTMQWKTVNADLAVTLTATTAGWVAVGFNPSVSMQDANLIIGYVNNGTVFIRDDFGVGINDHNPDTAIGGTDNVTILGGSEVSGVTQISFKIPLNSGDSKDQPLVIGNTYKIMLARGAPDFFTTQHTDRAYAFITIQ